MSYSSDEEQRGPYHKTVSDDAKQYLAMPEPKCEKSTKLFFRVAYMYIEKNTLTTEQILDVQDVLTDIFRRKREAFFEVACNFIRKVIKLKGNEQRAEDIATNAETFQEFYKLYFDTIPSCVEDQELLRNALEHAIFYLGPGDPYLELALQSFKLSWFSLYPIGGYTKDCVKLLLDIVSRKICHFPPTDESELDGLRGFLLKVSRRDDRSSGVITLLSKVVSDLYAVMKAINKTELCSTIQVSVPLHEIFSHVVDRNERNSWPAVAVLIRTLFSCDDPETNVNLIRANVSNVMLKMLEGSVLEAKRPEEDDDVVEALLLGLEAALSGQLEQDLKTELGRALSPLVLTYSGAFDPLTRSKACRAFTRFLEIAKPEDIIDQVTLSELIELLNSHQSSVQIAALKWVFRILEKIEEARLDENIFLTNEIKDTLLRLTASNEPTIKQAAEINISRLERPQDEATRQQARNFIYSISDDF